MKRLLAGLLLALVVFQVSACAAQVRDKEGEYSRVATLVTFSAHKVVGAYGRNLPPDFTGEKFLAFIRDRVSEHDYRILKAYRVEVRPKGWYYLLLLSDPGDGSLILFHFSCTPKVEAVWRDPARYDLNHLETYDPCRTR